MSQETQYFGLIKPAATDSYNVADFNTNSDIIDAEMHKPPLTVNGTEPDSTTRNIYLEKVPLADNLASDIAQINYGDFIVRTSGGDSSIESGPASLVTVKGNMIRTGYVAEVIDLEVTPVERAAGVDPITATINRETFVSYVPASGTVTLVYTTAWSADPTLYGITVTGTPATGDVITVDYTKEERGTITVAEPTAFNSTGWNLYDNNTGTARVVAYSTQYGYKIGGTYSLVYFSPTLTGERSAVTITAGLFNVSEDGYIFVTGGDATTYIYPTWSDWTDEYSGSFETYTVYTINLASIMALFDFGLCRVGDVFDEININVQKAIQRIERVAYDAETVATLDQAGTAYIYDTNYIYYVLDTPRVLADLSISGAYTVSDHGIEFFSNTAVPVYTETLYGENLKDKLRTDVVTLSEQTLTTAQKTQVQANIGIPASSLVHTTGNESVAGVKDFTTNGGVSVKNNESRYRLIDFKNNNGNKIGAVVCENGSSTVKNIVSPRCGFLQMSGKSGTADEGNTGYYEMYLTPSAERGLDENKTYTFITTKNLANNLTTTTEGLGLDARQGKVLNDVLTGLTSRIAFLDASSAKTFDMTVPNNSAFLLIANSNATGIHGIYHIAATSGGAVTVTTIGTAAGITTTTTTNKVTFDIGDTARPFSCAVILIRGTMPTI